MSTNEDQIKNIYSQQLAAEKDRLQQGYIAADAEYAAQKKTNQKITDENLNRTAVEAQKAAVSQSELHNAYGLSSGARAQARMALENQKASDMAAIRQSAQEQDAELERQRASLAQQYQYEIRQAQKENDMALAEALYKNAQTEQTKLDAQKEADATNNDQAAWTLAQIMMEAGDYTPAFNYLRSKGVNATHDQLVTLMGEYAPSENSLAPISSPAIEKFISENQSLEQLRNKVPKGYYDYLIKNALNKADLTFDEFEALERYYAVS